jgi:hypothetical protein
MAMDRMALAELLTYNAAFDMPSGEKRERIAEAERAPVKHLTVGVYPNNEYKTNCVPDFELAEHVQYNKDYRGGRGLFVDGVCVHRGGLTEQQVLDWTEKCKTIPMPKITYPRH